MPRVHRPSPQEIALEQAPHPGRHGRCRIVDGGLRPPPASGPLSFFITSAGSGKGADLGGLAGADAHCQRLATAAGAGRQSWRAYLSVPPTLPAGANPGVPAVNARDRIGAGPWFNAKGELVARDLAQLHGDNSLSKTSALDERARSSKAVATRPTSTTS